MYIAIRVGFSGFMLKFYCSRTSSLVRAMVAQAIRAPGLMYWFPSSSVWYSGLTWTTIERPIILRIPWSLIKLSSGFARALQVAIKNKLFNVKMNYRHLHKRTGLKWLALIEYTKSGQTISKWLNWPKVVSTDLNRSSGPKLWSQHGLNLVLMWSKLRM